MEVKCVTEYKAAIDFSLILLTILLNSCYISNTCPSRPHSSVNIEVFATTMKGRCETDYCLKVYKLWSLDYHLFISASLLLQEFLYISSYKVNDSSMLVVFKLEEMASVSLCSILATPGWTSEGFFHKGYRNLIFFSSKFSLFPTLPP